MKITYTDTGEIIEAAFPNADTQTFLYEKMAAAYFKSLQNEIALASAAIDKLKPGKKKVFLTRPIRIEISK